MLVNGFCNPSIECNTVDSWYQGSLSAIRLLAEDTHLILGRMLVDRQPSVALL